MNEEIIRIKRFCKPGEVDRNGYLYTRDEYEKEINSTRIKQLLERRMLGMELSHPEGDMLRHISIDPENVCGRIVEITDDYVDIIPTKRYVIDFINEYNTTGKDIYAGMRSIGTIEEKDGIKHIRNLRIITFDLILA